MGIIREYLKLIGAVSDATIEVFADRTRDAEVSVFRDSSSGVIFIDEFFVGEDEYVSAFYRQKSPNLEDSLDTDRRLASNLKLLRGRKILDFGFGDGTFLLRSKDFAGQLFGIELENRATRFGQKHGIPVFRSLSELPIAVDTIFAFHVLEHLPNPLDVLVEMRLALSSSGRLVVEVPHARDFLLSDNGPPQFKSFTLWSQHLVLHTRESLEKTLRYADFEVISIEGVQRYGLANHLGWFSQGIPGLHKVPPFSNFDQDSLRSAYQASLNSLDMTDTLVAIARPRVGQ